MKRHENIIGAILPQVCTCSGFGTKCPHKTAEHTAITPLDPNLARVFARSLGTPVAAPIDTSFFHRISSALRMGAVETLRPLLTHYGYELDNLGRQQKISLLWDALHGPFTVLPRKECDCCMPNQLIANTAVGAADHLTCLRLLLNATPAFNELAKEFNAKQSLIVTAASWLVKHQLGSDQPVLLSVLRKLDRAGIDVVTPGREDKEPPLHWSAMAGSFGCVAFLVLEKGVPVDLTTETTPDPPLFWAYKYGHQDAFAELLKLGATMTAINPKNGYGWAGIHGMALCRPWLGKPQQTMWEMAAAHDPSVKTARDLKGRTALHRAAACGNTPLIELLVKLGWDIGAQDNDGWTPLCLAINSGRLPPVKALCDLGAMQKVHCPPKILHRVASLAVLAGVHAYSQACIEQHYYYYPDLSTGEERPVNKFNWRGAYYEPCQENLGIIQALFDTTPSLRCMVCEDGRSVGCLALSLRLTDGSPGLLDTHAAALFRMFHRHGCNVLTRGPADEGTVLHAAAARGYVKTIEFLIKEAKANPNELSSKDPADNTGVPPVYAAVLHNKPKAAIRIMDLGGTPHGRRTDLTRWAIVRAAIYDTKLSIFPRLSIMDPDPLARRDKSTGMSCLDAAVYVSNLPVLKCILADLKPPGVTVTFRQALDAVFPLTIWAADGEEDGGGSGPPSVPGSPLLIALEEQHWECALSLLEAGAGVRYRGGPQSLTADGYVPALEAELAYVKGQAAMALALADGAKPESKAEKKRLELEWEKLEAERARQKAERDKAAAAVLAAAAKAAEAERRKKRMLDIRKTSSRSPSPSSPTSTSSPGGKSGSRSPSPSGSPTKGSPLGSPAKGSPVGSPKKGSPVGSASPSPPGSPSVKSRKDAFAVNAASKIPILELSPAQEIPKLPPPSPTASAKVSPSGTDKAKRSPSPGTAGSGKLTKMQALDAAKNAAEVMTHDQIELQRAVRARTERIKKGLDVVEEEEMKLLRKRERRQRRSRKAGANLQEDSSAGEEDFDDNDESESDDDDDDEPVAIAPGVAVAGRIFRMPAGAGGGREKTPEELRALAQKREEKRKKREREAFLLGPKRKEYLKLRATSDRLAKEVATLERILFLINAKANEHSLDWQKEMLKMYRRATRQDRWGMQAPGPRTVFPEPPDLRRYEGTTARDWFFELFGEDGIRRLQVDGYIEDGFMDVYIARQPSAPPAEEVELGFGEREQGERTATAVSGGSRSSRSSRASLAPIREEQVDGTSSGSVVGSPSYRADAVDDLLSLGVAAAKAKTTAPVLSLPVSDAVSAVSAVKLAGSGSSPTKAAAHSILGQQRRQENDGTVVAAAPPSPNRGSGGANAGGGGGKVGLAMRIASAFSLRKSSSGRR